MNDGSAAWEVRSLIHLKKSPVQVSRPFPAGHEEHAGKQIYFDGGYKNGEGKRRQWLAVGGFHGNGFLMDVDDSSLNVGVLLTGNYIIGNDLFIITVFHLAKPDC